MALMPVRPIAIELSGSTRSSCPAWHARRTPRGTGDSTVEAMLERFPYLDPTRVGVWGWSGGGSSTLHAMFKYPDLYHTGISVAPVPDQRYYDTIYQERYMGLPDDNEEGYREGSPINHAHKLEGNLMIMHGTADDNVHYQSFERLTDKLVKHGKLFSMMSYPMRSQA